MELLNRIEIYSAMPYSGDEDSQIDDWFHVARNEASEHIEAVWDIETLFRPEIPDEDKPVELMNLESVFDEIRFHYALNYTTQRYHEDLMLWAFKALKPGGKLQVISPDADWILRYWVADAVGVDAEKFVVPDARVEKLETENAELKAEIAKLKKEQEATLETLKPNGKPWYKKFLSTKRAEANVISEMLDAAGIPDESLPKMEHEDMAKEIPDRIIVDRKTDWDFDVWLMQQLYSSGAGEPQDCFKSMFGKRYLSQLLRRSRFIVTLLQNNPQNPKQLEGKIIRHSSRLL